MAREVHFEVFKRHGSKGGWNLHEVITDRDSAIELAESLMKDGEATGVKVVKETYDSDTGDFLTLKIFEEGFNQVKVSRQAEDVPHALPCFKPDDLYSYHARATMARVLAEYLARKKLTVTELIHRADALEELEATGTMFQHAIQKVAVAQASSTSTPVQQIIKSLNDLSEKAVQRVYRDERRKYFPTAEAGKFAELADGLSDNSDGAYILNAAIAKHLEDAPGWDEKLVRTLALIREAQNMDEGPGQTLLLTSADAIVSEILSGSAALHELIGPTECLGDAIMVLVHVFLGQEPPENGARGAGLVALAAHFAAGSLDEARTAVAKRILVELKSIKRLCPASLIDELKMLRKIANKLVLGQGKFLSHEDLIAAFTLRSKRLVTHESVGMMVRDIDEPDRKIEQMLTIEENIIGTENKRRLAEFIVPIATSASFESHFLFMNMPIITRLQRLSDLQSRVTRAGFQEQEKRDICEALDHVADEAEKRAGLFESIKARRSTTVDQALAIVRLCTTGSLTEGRLTQRAQETILQLLKTPGFLTGYTNHLVKTKGEIAGGSDGAMLELLGLLEKAGIAQETGLKAIAA